MLNGSKLTPVLTLIIIVVGLYLISLIFNKNTWTLMVCKSLMSNGVECYENSYVLEGYKSQNECMEKGIALASREGFECGRNCKPSKDYGGTVCEVICNRAGCNE